MSKEMTAVRQAQLRGELLDFLKKIYPEDIETTSVYRAFYDNYERSAIDKALEYLHDRGYVIRIERRDPLNPWGRRHDWKITPDGLDVKDGVTREEAILTETGR